MSSIRKQKKAIKKKYGVKKGKKLNTFSNFDDAFKYPSKKNNSVVYVDCNLKPVL